MKTIKSKITLGVIFLFSVILILSSSGIYFINKLAQNSKGTITDNYASVDYSTNMLVALDEMYQNKLGDNKEQDSENLYGISKEKFEINLKKEANNITEVGEAEIVHQLHLAFNSFSNSVEGEDYNTKERSYNNFRSKYLRLRQQVLNVYTINMKAIHDKTNQVQQSADNVTLYMSIIATLSVLITIFFIFTFPSTIAEPIKELTQKIKSISERNYEQKLDVKANDELGELASSFNIMVERLKLYEAKQIDQLIFEQKRLEAVVQSIDDGILFIDENRRIVLTNNKVLQLAGLKESELVHHYIPDIASKNDFIKEVNRILILKLSEDITEIKPLRVTLDGKEYFFNIVVDEIITFAKSENKETFIGSLIVLRNITEYQERDKAKTNLLATVSHELKTPLSSINLSLKLLDDKRLGEMNEDQKELLNSLKQQSNRLSRVINELLDYSQIETGNIRLKFSQVKPDMVLDIGITALMLQISQKKIDLQTKIEEDLPDIQIDLEKFAFVFINILSNAIRYSKDSGDIVISIKKSGDEVEFAIEDHGPGISKEDREKLFQRFTQVGDKFKHGWGLGLAISKEFVLAQGGRIWAESTLGVGSKFLFTIPAVKSK